MWEWLMSFNCHVYVLFKGNCKVVLKELLKVILKECLEVIFTWILKGNVKVVL